MVDWGDSGEFSILLFTRFIWKWVRQFNHCGRARWAWNRDFRKQWTGMGAPSVDRNVDIFTMNADRIHKRIIGGIRYVINYSSLSAWGIRTKIDSLTPWQREGTMRWMIWDDTCFARESGYNYWRESPTWSGWIQTHQMSLSPAYWSGLWDDGEGWNVERPDKTLTGSDVAVQLRYFPFRYRSTKNS